MPRPTALLLMLLLISACYRPGGGGTGHQPPDGIISNQPTELRITFYVWGAGSGRLDKRFTDVVCNYRRNAEHHYTQIHGSVIHADSENMEMVFVIPPLSLAAGDSVEYYFEMLFDGYRNTRPPETLSVIHGQAEPVNGLKHMANQ